MSLAHAVGALRRGTVPPTAGCVRPLDTGPGLRVTTGHQSSRLSSVLVNAFGFGGNYSSLLLSRPAVTA